MSWQYPSNYNNHKFPFRRIYNSYFSLIMNEETVGVRWEKQKICDQTKNQHYAFTFSRVSWNVLWPRKISDLLRRVDAVIARCICSAAYLVAGYRPPAANQSHMICQKTESPSTMISIP